MFLLIYNIDGRGKNSFDKIVFNFIIWDKLKQSKHFSKKGVKEPTGDQTQCYFIKKIKLFFLNSPLNLGKEFCLLGFSAVFECGYSCH